MTSKFDSSYKCTAFTVVNKNNVSSSNDFVSSLGQALVFTSGFVAEKKEQLSSFLRDEVSCLVGVILDDDNIDSIVYTLRKNWQHVTLKVGGSKPQPKEVARATYPIVHIEEGPKFNVQVFLSPLCPYFSNHFFCF